jgi:hypothetical protein
MNTSSIGPLPPEWCAAVIRILEKGHSERIRWSFRAQQDWQQFGMTHHAFEHLARTLRQAGVWGERIVGMDPLPDPPAGAGDQLVYAFLCPHPLGSPKPLYAKIGLFDDRVTIDLFSLHVDLSAKLEKRIAQARRKRK